MFYPDNFLYFISLLAIATFSSAHLLFSYARNKLLIINAFIFVLCAIRACTEYYLPQVESFDVATQIAIFHGIVTTLISNLFYFCIWFYIRPFKGWRYEKIINRLYLWLIVVLLFVLSLIPLISRKMFYFHEEKINGYWQFAVNEDYFLTLPFSLKAQILSAVMALIFLWSIIREQRERVQKSLLLVSWVVMPYLYFQFLEISGEWNIPNIAGIYVIHSLIISWFVSGYRLFTDGFAEARQDLLNSVSDLAISTDLNQIINFANQKARDLFTVSTQPIAQLLTNYSSSTSTSKEMEQILQALLKQQSSSEILHLQSDQNLEKIFEIKVAPVRTNGRAIGYTFLLTDLTEIKEKEEQLIQLGQMKDQLFAIIGHDLRKPALAFRGISKKVNYLIQKQAYQRLNRMGQQLEKAAFNLSGLLENLLEWALQQQKTSVHYPQNIQVKTAIENIHDLFASQFIYKKINYNTDIATELKVYVDTYAFSTIFRNLLDNALKFTPKNGSIQITAMSYQDKVKIIVTDTGTGIAAEKIDQLFNLQKNKSTADTQGSTSTGLGLNLVKELIEQQKGRIEVFSQVGQGTRFEIVLPTRSLIDI